MGSVGYAHFPALLTTAVVLCWGGILWPLIQHPSSPREWVEIVAVGAYLPAFAVLSPALRAPRSGSGAVGAVGVALAGLLATLTSDHESLSPVTLCVTAATIGFALPRLQVWIVLSVQILALIYGAYAEFVDVQWAIVFSAMMIFAAMVVEVSVREFYGRAQLLATSAELESANHALELAQRRLADETRDAERLRIARDLHDTVGHHLTALSLRLEILSHLTDGDAARHVDESRRMVRATLTEVRAAVSRLREPEVDLVTSLQRLAATAGLPSAVVSVDPAVRDCGRLAGEAAYRTVQESLTNVARHAQATRVEVHVGCPAGELVVVVSDNGIGVDGVVPGNGLTGMQERVAEVGGTLRWGPGPLGGCTIEARIPCRPHGETAAD